MPMTLHMRPPAPTSSSTSAPTLEDPQSTKVSHSSGSDMRTFPLFSAFSLFYYPPFITSSVPHACTRHAVPGRAVYLAASQAPEARV